MNRKNFRVGIAVLWLISGAVVLFNTRAWWNSVFPFAMGVLFLYAAFNERK